MIIDSHTHAWLKWPYQPQVPDEESRGKAEQLLYEMNHLVEEHRIENTSVFLDSPLAIKATRIYYNYQGYFDKEAKDTIKSGDDVFDFRGLTITKTGEESREILRAKKPKGLFFRLHAMSQIHESINLTHRLHIDNPIFLEASSPIEALLESVQTQYYFRVLIHL